MRQAKPQDIFRLSKYNKYLLVAVFIARDSLLYIYIYLTHSLTYIMAFLSAIVDDITADVLLLLLIVSCANG